ncbi:uncharacterized protein LOC143099908 [Alosa pseudoharengus]|uniref:uncharacterized protein LOC143099908 n=1 Tax=Alosa pseudoharengus TaxID=34774 RepID=UPI003F88CDBD
MDLPQEEAVPRLADILPVQGHVVQADVKPDAGLEKMESPAELRPVVQEEPAPVKQEAVVEEKTVQQEPAPAKQETVVEEKQAQMVPVVQEKPAEQEPLEQDKPAEQEPLVEQDKPAEQEPLEQDKPAEQEPLEQVKPAEQEPLVEKVQEEVHKEVQPKEDVLDENVSDLKVSLSANRLPEEEPAMEEKYIVSDEPVKRSELPVEEETVVQEVHPEPGRPGLVEEPRMELIAEEEEGMYGKLTEEEDEMAEVPEMVLEPLPEEEPVEDGAGTETDLWDPRLRLVEEPTIELEPLFGEELTSDDEPGSEAVPGEEEELMGEEGPVMPGEMVVEEEESPGQEPIMEIDPDEEPVPWARSGLAEGPLMDGMTVKQAMMEEEPEMWVGPGVMRERHMQNMEEKPEMWARTDEDAAAMAREMDMDNEILVGMESSDGEQARPYAEDVRPMDGEFPDAVYTKRSSCSGAIIDGRCYQFFRGPKEAADAEFFCQNNFPNGHLASVTSPYIHQQMMNLMAQNGGYTRTWVGGLKYLKTGRFIWLDGAHWGYADWLPGEPNDTIGVEDCIELLSNGKFNDMPCWDLRAYICSYPL